MEFANNVIKLALNVRTIVITALNVQLIYYLIQINAMINAQQIHTKKTIIASNAIQVVLRVEISKSHLV